MTATPRILADLRAVGETVSRKTVAASLRRQGRRGDGYTLLLDLGAFTPWRPTGDPRM